MNQEELLAELRPWLKSVAMRYVQDPGAQQDLAQEGWIAAWRQLQDPTTSEDNVVGWCKQAALWHMRRMLTGHQPTFGASRRTYGTAAVKNIPVNDYDLPIWETLREVHDYVELAYHHGEIYQAISELSPQQREYIDLRFFKDWSYTELLDHFGSNPSSIWRWARPKLAAKLEHLR